MGLRGKLFGINQFYSYCLWKSNLKENFSKKKHLLFFFLEQLLSILLKKFHFVIFLCFISLFQKRVFEQYCKLIFLPSNKVPFCVLLNASILNINHWFHRVLPPFNTFTANQKLVHNINTFNTDSDCVKIYTIISETSWINNSVEAKLFHYYYYY